MGAGVACRYRQPPFKGDRSGVKLFSLSQINISYSFSSLSCSDLHTRNILLGSKGQLLLSYFYQCAGFDAASQISISPRALDGFYIAPERPLTTKSDWWSFGVILFELLTGYVSTSNYPLIKPIKTRNVPPPRPTSHAILPATTATLKCNTRKQWRLARLRWIY